MNDTLTLKEALHEVVQDEGMRTTYYRMVS